MDLCNETNIELRQFLLLEYSIKDVRAKIVQWIDFKRKYRENQLLVSEM